MKVTEVNITDMNPIDGSSNKRYSAMINGKRCMYQANGQQYPYLTHDEWVEFVKDFYKEEQKV